jgi:hypothetical protein
MEIETERLPVIFISLCAAAIYHINNREAIKATQIFVLYFRRAIAPRKWRGERAPYFTCKTHSRSKNLQQLSISRFFSLCCCRRCGCRREREREKDEINVKCPKIYITLGMLWKFNGPSYMPGIGK